MNLDLDFSIDPGSTINVSAEYAGDLSLDIDAEQERSGPRPSKASHTA